MANVCEYSVCVEGHHEDLRAMIAFLSPAIRRCPDGYYSPNILELEQLFSGLEQEHTWIGLDHYGDDPGNCFEWASDSIEFHGACKWGPPEPFLRRLSIRFRTVTFRCEATTEHEECDRFEVRSGVTRILDHFIDDIQGFQTVWYWRDCQEFDPPRIEHHPNDENDHHVPATEMP
jgi:hypothetical protein